MWEIDPNYSLRVIKGEEWSKSKCLRCEVDKITNGIDYEVKEVIYVKDTDWICVSKMEL